MSEWQPIETAPKDGEIILLWLKSGGKPVLGYRKLWWARSWLKFEFLDHLDEWRTVRATSSAHDICGPLDWSEDRLIGLSHEPTHWMPLPEAPK